MPAAARIARAAVGRALKAAGLRARHALCQNFLADVDVLEAILGEASPAPGRGVLEIGPGLGFLTRGLLAGGAAGNAWERSPRRVRLFRTAFQSPDEDRRLPCAASSALVHEVSRAHRPPV